MGNQLVSYTRQMDLVRIREQAKFENASLRTKHFRIWKVIFQSVSFLKMRFRILLALLYAPNPFGACRTPIDYRSMFRVIHLAWSGCRAIKTFVGVGQHSWEKWGLLFHPTRNLSHNKFAHARTQLANRSNMLTSERVTVGKETWRSFRQENPLLRRFNGRACGFRCISGLILSATNWNWARERREKFR